MPVQPARTVSLALVQVADERALRARIPTGLERGTALAEECVRAAAAAVGGELVPAAVRGCLVQLPDASAAARFGVDLQRALLELPWPPTLLVRPEAAEGKDPTGRLLFRGLRLRVAVHVGRATVQEDGRLGGPGVYQLARLAAVTAGGQVLLSEAAWRALRGPALGGVVLRDLGDHALVGCDGLGRLVQILPAELDGRVFAALPERPSTNLSVHDDGTSGRDGDVSALRELALMDIRLVTVVGEPGVGKSRVCRLAARAVHGSGRFPGGVWWVRPGEATISALVRSVASVFGVPLDVSGTVSDAVDRVGWALADRGRLVLVLDHLAHRSGRSEFLRDLRHVLDLWLRVARSATFIVNTDTRLGLTGEVLYVLLPLSAREEHAVALFTARAQAVDADVRAEDPAAVREIVDHAAGVPLLVRLLAGIVDRFPVQSQLEHARAGQLGPDHVLPIVLDHLDDEELQVLEAATALPGAFEPGLLGVDFDAVPVLDRLDRRGLIRRSAEREAPDVGRYQIEEDVRRRVLERVPVEEVRAIRDLRARRLVEACEAWSSGPNERDRTELVARLALEWDGLLEVVRIGLEEAREDAEAILVAGRAALALRPVLEARGPAWVAVEVLDAIVRRMDAMLDADPLVHQRVLVMRAQALRRVSKAAVAEGDLDRAEAMADRWSDGAGRAAALLEAGRIQHECGSAELAARRFEAAQQGWHVLGDAASAAVAETFLADVRMSQGRYDEAQGWLHRALVGLRAGQRRLYEARAIGILAKLHRRADDPDAARALYREALRIARECGVPTLETRLLAEFGLLELNLDRAAESRRLLAAAGARARACGDRAGEGVAFRDLGVVELLDGNSAAAAEALLSAVALHRDLGQRGAEGADTGSLGWVHHVEGRLDEAREAYRAALALVDEHGDSRLMALFAGWLACCEAERGDTVAAVAGLEVARIKQADSGDPQVQLALDLLGLPVRWRELLARPDPAGSAELAHAYAGLRGQLALRTQPLPTFPRLAWRRISALPALAALAAEAQDDAAPSDG